MHKPWSGLSISEKHLRTARLGSGLVLMVFVSMHLANLALNLISLSAAEAGRFWFLLFWRNPVGTVILYGSVLVHLVLVLRSLYMRRTLVMPLRESIQTALGLLIPLFLAEHVIGTRVFNWLSGVDDSYAFVLRALWIVTPMVGARQAIALVVVWAHGCLGLYFWLRFRPWFPRWASLLLVITVLVPVLALLGFSHGGQEVAAIEPAPLPSDVDQLQVGYALRMKDILVYSVYGGFTAILALLLVLRALRMRRERRNLVEVRYADGQVVRVPKGFSVLEASRIGGIPHYSICGGKGRCSTCRVQVIEGLSDLPSPGPVEQATLSRISAEPHVRLACQIRPDHDLKVMPLLAPVGVRLGPAGSQLSVPGREREIAILFCDIRSFTALSDHRLPFDIVFLLNRYFAVVGKAVEQAGGQLDKFIGDGAMALFGFDTPKEEACRHVLVAAAAILRDVAHLSEELQGELSLPLRVAIGIHVGPAIVGAMGYGRVMSVTAIGDTVNTASRLESVAKELDAAIVVSASAARLSGLDLSAFEIRQIDIRGLARPLSVHVVPQGAVLPVMTLGDSPVTVVKRA